MSLTTGKTLDQLRQMVVSIDGEYREIEQRWNEDQEATWNDEGRRPPHVSECSEGGDAWEELNRLQSNREVISWEIKRRESLIEARDRNRCEADAHRERLYTPQYLR